MSSVILLLNVLCLLFDDVNYLYVIFWFLLLFDGYDFWCKISQPKKPLPLSIMVATIIVPLSIMVEIKIRRNNLRNHYFLFLKIYESLLSRWEFIELGLGFCQTLTLTLTKISSNISLVSLLFIIYYHHWISSLG